MDGLFEGVKRALTDRCHVERELGRGGSAPVYVVRAFEHRRRVALEVVRPELAALRADPELEPEAAFLEELERMRSGMWLACYFTTANPATSGPAPQPPASKTP